MEKITYLKCLEILNDLSQIKSPALADIKDFKDKDKYIPSGKFLYAVAKNISKLESIQKTLQKVIEEKAEFKKFLEERDQVNKQFAIKDDDGQPKLKETFFNGQMQMSYVIDGIDSPESPYSTKVTALKKKYKAEIEERDKQIDRYNELIKSESEFVPFMISIDEVPLGLPAETWKSLFYIIKEEKEEKNEVSKAQK